MLTESKGLAKNQLSLIFRMVLEFEQIVQLGNEWFSLTIVSPHNPFLWLQQGRAWACSRSVNFIPVSS